MAARFSSLLLQLRAELGVDFLISSSRDTKLLCLQRFVRLFAYGASTLVLALYLSSLGVSEARIGLFMTLTLLGDVVISFALTLIADGLGRRRILIAGAALMTASGIVFSLTGNYWILVAASIFGVISPSGNEIGPFRAVEESTLAHLTPSTNRSEIFAWYTLLGNAGTAFGTIVCGWIVEELRSVSGWTETRAYRFIFGVYAFLGIIKLLLSLLLSDKCEPEVQAKDEQPAHQDHAVEMQGFLSDSEDDEENQSPSKPAPTAPEVKNKKSIWPSISLSSQSIVVKLCLLFVLDSFASGLVPLSWMTYFFDRKYSLPEGQLGTIFFITNIISSLSNLVAASISKRIGLIRTMVFTHLPSSIFLALIPVPSNVGLAITFLVLRFSMAKMDQAPRQAFLAAVVLPNERTAVMGIVNVVKTLSQSGGPILTGFLAGTGRFWLAFVLAGGLKVGYDLLLLRFFLRHKTHEDQARESINHVVRPGSSNGQA